MSVLSADAGVAAEAPRTIGGHALREVIGRGRQSVVYRASRRGADVALKVSSVVDFEHERWLLQALAGAGVIEAHEHGHCAEGSWLALELASGGSLARTRTGAQDATTVARWLADCARTLAHVHRQGWVHRDLKPAHLLLRADGSLALGDFGSACLRGTPTPKGQVTGTPLYASPEQGEGAPASPAVDVYALGAMLHEWLTGRPPFPGETLAEQSAQHQLAPVPCLPARVSRWQPLLDAMLDKDPGRRLPDGHAILCRIPS